MVRSEVMLIRDSSWYLSEVKGQRTGLIEESPFENQCAWLQIDWSATLSGRSGDERTTYFKYTICFAIYWGFESWWKGWRKEISPMTPHSWAWEWAIIPYIHTLSHDTQTQTTDVSRNKRVNMIVTHTGLTYMLQKTLVDTEMTSVKTVKLCCWVLFSPRTCSTNTHCFINGIY